MALLPKSVAKISPGSLLKAGRAAFKIEDYSGSERHFLAALEAGAAPGECHLHLARIYNRNQDWPRALEQWSWLHEEDSAQIEPQLQVARAQLRLGRFGEAAEGFNAILARAPDNADVRKNLAAALVGAGRATFKTDDCAASEQHFLAALEAGAPAGECRRYLARIYNRIQDWPRALGQWGWLRSEDPGQLEPRLQVARMDLHLGRYGEAAMGFRSVLDIEPEHAEARQSLNEVEALDRGKILVPKNPKPESAAPAPTEGVSAAGIDSYARSEAGVLAAIRAGADETVCRLLLARIYNLKQDWRAALEQWSWLHNRYPGHLEPDLQLARGQFKLGMYAEAKTAFEAFLRLIPDHQEAQETLREINVILDQQTPEADIEKSRDWLSRVPEHLRWSLSADLLDAEIGALEATVDLAARQATALGALVDAYACTKGEISTQRELYGVQASAGIDEVKSQLKGASRALRELGHRTERMLTTFRKLADQPLPATSAAVAKPPMASWRTAVARLAVDTYRAHGLAAALRWLFRIGRVEERPAMLADFASVIRAIDHDAATHAYWLAYGAAPSPGAAERMAKLILHGGDQHDSGIPLEAALPGENGQRLGARTRPTTDFPELEKGVDGAAGTG
jgi:tetratricopeptide (TPR) repeat protein